MNEANVTYVFPNVLRRRDVDSELVRTGAENTGTQHERLKIIANWSRILRDCN